MKMIYVLLIALFFFEDSDARIIPIHTAHDILAEVDKDTLVLFDIDNTTLTPSTALGSGPWFDHLKEKLKTTGVDKDDFRHRVSIILRHAHHIPCEETLPELIRSLQARGIPVWGLTARLKNPPWDPHFDRTTQLHLASVGVDFECSQIPLQCKLDTKNPPSMFAHGIIFTSWTHKGPVLVDFLKQIDYRPAKIVFIDDQPSFLDSVKESLHKENIPFVGYHYKGWEKSVVNFDLLTANIQLLCLDLFGHLISNEEAEKIKLDLITKDPHLHPDFYLDLVLERHAAVL